MSGEPEHNLDENPLECHNQAKNLLLTEGKNPSFDPMLALERIRRANRGAKIRKLSFAEQCGAFAALYGGARNAVVAKAFGISAITASYLGGCLENDPSRTRRSIKWTGEGDGEIIQTPCDHNAHRDPERRRRYEDVGREFEALGEEEFVRRYLTPAVYARVQKAHNEFAAARRAAAQEKDRNRG